MHIPEISVHELDALRRAQADIFLLDVRNSDEYAICNLGGYLIPLHELAARTKELNLNHDIIVHCRSGGRSMRATEFLLGQGFQKVRNLQGGILAWAEQVDLEMARY